LNHLFELQIQPLPIITLVRIASTRLVGQFEEKFGGLEIDLPTDLPSLLVYEDRLGQVMLNLMVTARYFITYSQ
jgi:signal transduction histidine kinase